jgi:hypothetical protein
MRRSGSTAPVSEVGPSNLLDAPITGKCRAFVFDANIGALTGHRTVTG